MQPTSKVIQIQLDPENKVIVVLCEDGSIWERETIPFANDGKKKVLWNLVLNPFQPIN